MIVQEAPLLSPSAEKIEGQEANEKFALLAEVANDSPFKNGTFVDFEELERARGDEIATLIVNKETSWPLNNIVGAIGFSSWDEGRENGHLKDGKTSKEVMQEYASRNTEIPGVNFGLDVYQYTDDEGENKLFAVSHNAHRVGAAKLKNQRNIGVSGKMSIYHLAQKPEELEELSTSINLD